jgi:DNA-nicking Smr family endonuclease
MTSDNNHTDDDDLFRKTIGAIQPLKTEARHSTKKPFSNKSLAAELVRQASAVTRLDIDKNSWDDFDDMPSLHLLDESISHTFMRPGLQHRTMKQLRRGKITLDDSLDLHGSTARQARQQLGNFIAVSIANKFRAVIIVHGKGLRSTNNTPVLKTRVNYWLRDNESVMGFCPAPSHHGGSGALYVLLKR